MADWADSNINYARNFYKADPQHWYYNSGVDNAADIVSMAVDPLRAGSGVGYALYDPNATPLQRALAIANDAGRAAAIAAAVGAVASRIVGIIARFGAPAVVIEEACPFNPFKGKTPPEIDEMFRNKGFEPRGPNPMNGEGNYVNPKTGRGYHIDNHPPPKPPHVGVHRPRGKRNTLGPREFPL